MLPKQPYGNILAGIATLSYVKGRAIVLPEEDNIFITSLVENGSLERSVCGVNHLRVLL